MDLHSLFSALERAGITTLGQAKSALVAAGISPESVFLNHGELADVVKALKPVAVSAATAAVSESVAEVAPAAAPIAGQLADDVALALVPHLEHLVEGVEIRLPDALSGHVHRMGQAIATAVQEAPALKGPPAAP
jgi:hypothetical protein